MPHPPEVRRGCLPCRNVHSHELMRTVGPDPHRIVRLARGLVYDFLRTTPMLEHHRDEMLSDALNAAAVYLPKWDPQRGCTVQTYLWMKMRYGVIEGIRDRAPIGRGRYHRGVRLEHLPVWQLSSLSIEYLAERADSSGDQIDLGLPVPDPRAEHAYAEVDTRLAVEQLLTILSDRQREVIVRIHLGGETGREVAADWGVTESAVSQVHTKAMRCMRRELTR
jgi:RNA polymerase sigma factor (sigma-70 family)